MPSDNDLIPIGEIFKAIAKSNILWPVKKVSLDEFKKIYPDIDEEKV